jgi:hypothetical protein
MKNVSDKPCRENQNTQFIFDYFFENRTVYEIMWKNVVEPDRPRMTVGSMRFACRITKATDINSAYAVLIACQRQQWFRACASM